MSNLLVSTNNKICAIDSNTKKIKNLNLNNEISMPYGITWDKKFFYIVSREQNDCKIKCLDKYFKFSKTLIKDLPKEIHQILLYDNELWMVSPLTNSIIIYNLKNRKIKNFDLIEFKFKEIKVEKDINHFNSILIKENRIYVSAHNHQSPSFILELDKNLKLLNKYEMGNQIHCIFYNDNNDKIYTLDSNGSKKIINNKKEQIDIGCSGYDFLRGIAVSDKEVFVGVFTEGKFREDRLKGDGKIKILNKNFELKDEIIIENSGDIAEIRILDEKDFVHNNIIKKSFLYL